MIATTQMKKRENFETHLVFNKAFTVWGGNLQTFFIY